MIDTYCCYYDEAKSMYDLYEDEKDIILNQSQIKITGNQIAEHFYGIKGKQIGKIKEYLFEEITNGNVMNITDDLIKYLDSIDIISLSS